MYSGERDIESQEIVGREEELSKMRGALDKVIEGKGQAVFVSGEAGMGMTRVVEELLKEAEDRGVRTIRTRCLFSEGGDPYLPFLDALKGFSDELGSAVGSEPDTTEQSGTGEPDRDPGTSGGILPMGLMGIGGEGHGGGSGADATGTTRTPGAAMGTRNAGSSRGQGTSGTEFTRQRDQMFSIITGILSDLTEERPVAFFLDDLQWADQATLQLLSFVLRNSHDQGLMLIGAYRRAEVESTKGHPLKEVISRARREGITIEIGLEPLGREDIEAMIGSVLGVDRVPESFTGMMYDKTEGNPFFVKEFLASMVRRGIIPEEGADLSEVDVSRVKPPSSVTDLIANKLEELDEVQNKVLEYAAVVGEVFEMDTLATVLDMDEMELVDVLERLIQLQIVEEFTEDGDIRYRFIHNQFREHLYNDLSSARRRLAHKKVGLAMEGLPEKERVKRLFPLAHHLSMARETERAIKYGTMAAERAERSFAADDAIAYYQKALELVDRAPPSEETARQKKELVAKIARLKFMTESWNEAMQYLEALRAVAEDQDDDVMLAEVYRKMGHIESMRGAWTRASDDYDRALGISEGIEDKHGVAESLRGLGNIATVRADYEMARAFLEKSLKISREIGDTRSQGRTHIELGHVFKDQGMYEEALGSYTEALIMLEEQEDRFSMTRAYMSIGDLCIRTEEWKRAVEFYGKAQDMAERTSDSQMLSWAMFKLGVCHAQLEEFDRAEDLCGKALMRLLRSDDRVGLAYAYSSYGVVYRLKGDYGKAFVQFQQAMNTANDLDMPAVTANINLEIGLMHRDKGDTGSAKRFFEKSRKLYEKVEAKALAEQAARLLEGVERYGAPKDSSAEHFLDKSMKALQKRTQRRAERNGKANGARNGKRNGRRKGAKNGNGKAVVRRVGRNSMMRRNSKEEEEE